MYLVDWTDHVAQGGYCNIIQECPKQTYAERAKLEGDNKLAELEVLLHIGAVTL